MGKGERQTRVVRTSRIGVTLTSYNTTFVTSPSVAHSSLTSSLRSKSSEGSSSSSPRVNMCLRTTTLPFLSLNLSAAESVGPNSSPESQSSNFLMPHEVHLVEISREHTFAFYQSSSSPSSYSRPSFLLLVPLHLAGAYAQTRLSEPSSLWMHHPTEVRPRPSGSPRV